MSRHATRTVVFALVATLAFVGVIGSAYATGMSIEADTESADRIVLAGETTRTEDISIKIETLDNTLVDIKQVVPNEDGTFETTFVIGDSWKNGIYFITAQQGDVRQSTYRLNLIFEIADGQVINEIRREQSSMTGPSAITIEQPIRENSMMITASATSGDAEFTFEDDRYMSIVPADGAWEEITTIIVTGETTMSNDVVLTVRQEDGNIVSVAQVSPDEEGMFETAFHTNSELWKQDGAYTITATQDDLVDFVVVYIADGAVVPEFGATAALILAAAITSILVVSTRFRPMLWR